MEILPALSTSPTETSLTDLAARIQAAHEAATTSMRRGCEHAINAGRLLIEAKNQVPHGQWLHWLKKHCQVSERMAQHYMTLARHFEANPQRVADLPMRQAIKVITAPERLKHNKQTTNLSPPGPKSQPIPELNSLSWSDASPEQRRKFVDAVGPRDLWEAMPEAAKEWMRETVKTELNLAAATKVEQSEGRPQT